MLELFPFLGYNKGRSELNVICEKKRRYEMTITITLKGMILTILAVLGMILLVYLILLIRKLIGTLKGVDAVLKDAKTVSSVAADQAENLDDVIEGAALAVGTITDAISGNQSIVAAFTSVVNTISSVIGMIRGESEEAEVSDDEE